MDINDIDDDDLELDDPQEESSSYYDDNNDDNQVGSGWERMKDEDEESSYYGDPDNVDVLSEFLKDNGIEDPERIKFTDENGYMQERSWNDLSGQELLNILRSNQREPEESLDDDEIAFINQLRANGLSPQEYLQLVGDNFNTQIQQAQQIAAANAQEPTFTSDLLSDDELFVLDLQSRIPDITNEELETALYNAKSNEDFYYKLINGIRDEYRRLESENEEREAAIAYQEQQELYNQYAGAITNEIANLSNIGSLDINMDSDDMDELADFILAQDEAGVNYFNKALLDPQTLVQMAWFALHGEDIFNEMENFYAKQLSLALQSGFEQGYIYANLNLYYLPEVVVQHKERNYNQNNKVKSINDLDDEF